ncbi:hypothetical protein MWU59_11700 [Flavobacteriaceae bacterium F08102]|nr:hypothetical protein [Flavobacteriaceae bacterium F08102]
MPENPVLFALYFVSSFGYMLGLISLVYGFKTKSKPAKYFAFVVWTISTLMLVLSLLYDT